MEEKRKKGLVTRTTRSLGAHSSASNEGLERRSLHRNQERERESEEGTEFEERRKQKGQAKDSSSKKESVNVSAFSLSPTRPLSLAPARPLLFFL